MSSRLARAIVASAIVAVGGVTYLLVSKKQIVSLPYQDHFARGYATEWVPYGGSWRLEGDAITNRSDESGAKLIMGSPLWSNYQMTTDLELRAHGGDVGLIVRAGDPEIGLDAYRGYYIGLRSGDSALVVGRADHNWLEGQPVAINGGVEPGIWYRIHVVIVNCEIGAEATNLTSGRKSYAALRDSENCIRNGEIGLRSMDTGGSWKNIHVASATEDDLHRITRQAAGFDIPQYPIREDKYSRMRESYFPGIHPISDRYSGGQGSSKENEIYPLTSIDSLRAESTHGASARIRGIITFASPTYLQDSTGGIRLLPSDAEMLNLGDEVEAMGHLVAEGSTFSFNVSQVRLLWDRTPLAPASITPTEAASGMHDGSLVELNGVVLSRTTQTDGTITFRLAESAQIFDVVLQSTLFDAASEDWTIGSTLRVRGICAVAPIASSDDASFTVLVALASDIKLVSKAPWWTGWRFVRVLASFGLLLGIGVYFFLKIEQSKMRAIMRERERLSHEMHDTLAQSFAGVGYHLQGMRRSLREDNLLPPPLMQELDMACDMVTLTHREASATIAALHPDAHDQGDLLMALERSTVSMLDGNYLPTVLRREGEPWQLSPVQRDVLFRIGLEAITNVLRHSGSKSMELALCFRPRMVTLSVKDYGIGFDPRLHSAGFGLQTMQRRCKAAGATLTVAAKPGGGCIVAVSSPYRMRSSLMSRLMRVIR